MDFYNDPLLRLIRSPLHTGLCVLESEAVLYGDTSWVEDNNKTVGTTALPVLCIKREKNGLIKIFTDCILHYITRRYNFLRFNIPGEANCVVRISYGGIRAAAAEELMLLGHRLI